MLIQGQRYEDIIIPKAAKNLGISEDLVDKILRFQFKYTSKAFSNESSIELTGFGSFKTKEVVLNKKLAKHLMILEYLEDTLENAKDEKTIKRYKRNIEVVLRKLDILYRKLHIND